MSSTMNVIKGAGRNPRCRDRFLKMKSAGQVDEHIVEMYDNAHLAPEGKRQRQSDVIWGCLLRIPFRGNM